MGKIRQIWSHCMERESPKWKQKHRHKVLQLLVPHTYLLACLRASSPPWEFLLTSSATRCWNATKKTGWPNFPKVAQKVATAVFLKRDGFQNSPKHYHTFGISLPENLWPRSLIFFQIWSPCSLSRPTWSNNSFVLVIFFLFFVLLLEKNYNYVLLRDLPIKGEKTTTKAFLSLLSYLPTSENSKK